MQNLLSLKHVESVVKATSLSKIAWFRVSPLRQVGKDEFVAKVDARDYLQTGATVELRFDLNKALLRCRETEKNSLLSK